MDILNYENMAFEILALLVLLVSAYYCFRLGQKFGISFLFDKTERGMKSKPYRDRRAWLMVYITILIAVYHTLVILYSVHNNNFSLLRVLKETLFYLLVMFIAIMIGNHINTNQSVTSAKPEEPLL